MPSTDHPVIVVGAGPSGLAMARHLKEQAIPFLVLEQDSGVGGLWRYGSPQSAVYASAHLISSKRGTEYPDFPFPDDCPDYPRHDRVCAYLEDYARHFGLMEHIRFGASVEATGKTDSGWRVQIAGSDAIDASDLIIANGHLWDPVTPDIPGDFSGTALHSAQYKTPDLFDDKRVLVVGSGNSGCDIAVDAVHRARSVSWSVRSGSWFVPKFIGGKPADASSGGWLKSLLPLSLRARIDETLLKIVMGSPEQYGLPAPANGLYGSVPVVNSLVLHHVGHGDVAVRRPPARFEGPRVVYEDQTSEEIDVIVFATGFRVSVPFVDREHLNWKGSAPDLALNIFAPAHDDLFVIGLIEATGGGFHVRDAQAQLVAAFLDTKAGAPQAAERFHRDLVARHIAQSQGGGIFVNYFTYKKGVLAMAESLRGQMAKAA